LATPILLAKLPGFAFCVLFCPLLAPEPEPDPDAGALLRRFFPSSWFARFSCFFFWFFSRSGGKGQRCMWISGKVQEVPARIISSKETGFLFAMLNNPEN
jgi:hypothetical protein